jgi:hypothetical protein
VTRRRITAADHAEDAATAREVLAATGKVTGATIDRLTSRSAFYSPEVNCIRHAAAVALVAAGWTRSRAVRHLHVARKTLVGRGIVDRLRRNAPLLMAAAERAALAAVGRKSTRTTAATAAREAMRHEAAAAGIPIGEASTSLSSPARRVRIKVAKRLYARSYSGAEIADALGYGETTIYRWISVSTY